MQRNCTHATKAPNRSPARPRARHQPQLFPTPCYSTWAATKRRGNVPGRVLIRNRIHATKLHPCNGALRSQHVSGHETGPNRSPRRAAARGRLRNARKTFPSACWMKMKPHPCNETAPMQRTHLNRSPARPRARTRPELFPAPCCSTWAATKRKKNVPERVLDEDETAPMQRNCTHATNPPKPLPSTSPGTKPALTVPRAVLQHMRGYDSRGKRSRARA